MLLVSTLERWPVELAWVLLVGSVPGRPEISSSAVPVRQRFWRPLLEQLLQKLELLPLGFLPPHSLLLRFWMQHP